MEQIPPVVRALIWVDQTDEWEEREKRKGREEREEQNGY
jgi:hypothetical protein